MGIKVLKERGGGPVSASNSKKTEPRLDVDKTREKLVRLGRVPTRRLRASCRSSVERSRPVR